MGQGGALPLTNICRLHSNGLKACSKYRYNIFGSIPKSIFEVLDFVLDLVILTYFHENS